MATTDNEDWRPWVFYNGRPTNEESARRRRHLMAIGREIAPTNVRGFMYAVVVRGLLDKEVAYSSVQYLLSEMRETGEMPWDWIVDETRPVFIPNTWTDAGEVLEAAAKQFRRDAWQDLAVKVVVLVEKIGIAGALRQTVEGLGVRLYTMVGQFSSTRTRDLANYMEEDERHTLILQLGDHDHYGVEIVSVTEDKLRRYTGASFEMRRIAVTPEQIRRYRLPTRPKSLAPKEKARFRNIKIKDNRIVELDAMPANELRALLEREVMALMPPDHLDQVKEDEASERAEIERMVKALRRRRR